MRYDTNDLIRAIKRTAIIPTNQRTFDDLAFIEIANFELLTTVVPIIQSAVEDYFVDFVDFTLTSANNTLTIPNEATGFRIKQVYYITGIGGDLLEPVPRISIDYISGWPNHSAVSGFYLENDEIKFYPKVTSTKYIRVYFYRKPNDLVEVSSGGTVIDIDTLSNTITLDNVPVSWDASTVVDIIKSAPPFKLRHEDAVVQARAGADLTLLPADMEGIELGDLVYLANEACVAQYIPIEAWFLLVQAAKTKCLEALQDKSGFEASMLRFNEMKSRMLDIISPRVVSATKRVVNTSSIINAAKSRRKGFWR
jgi:hypothetical protein